MRSSRCTARSNRTRASPTTASARADVAKISTSPRRSGSSGGAARSTGNDASADALKRMADEAVQIARVSPVHREYVPTLGPLELCRGARLRDATADVDVTARAAALEAVLAACRGAKVTRRRLSQRPRLGNGRRDGQRQSPLLPIQRSRPQRDSAERGRHRVRLLRRRSLRSRRGSTPKRIAEQAVDKAVRSQGRQSRSSPAPIRSSSSRRRWRI